MESFRDHGPFPRMLEYSIAVWMGLTGCDLLDPAPLQSHHAHSCGTVIFQIAQENDRFYTHVLPILH